MSRLLGDDEDRGQLLLGGQGQASSGSPLSAFRGGGGALKITRDRLRPVVSAISPTPAPPGGGGGGGGRGGGGFYQQQ